MTRRFLAWFSCGAASAVAAKLAVEKYGSACDVVYCDTMATEHADNARFFSDVERWLGRNIIKVRSAKYETIDQVFERERYMSGVGGAKCTVVMKKWPRVAFQRPTDTHIFGYTADEQRRADSFEESNKDLAVEWILIDRLVRKEDCYRVLKEAGIALPAMYALGFEHNNCLGCVKAQSPAYWNKIRILFPEVFARRVQQSRMLGVRLAKVGGERVYLDELPADATGPREDIDCGPVCQTRLDLGAA